ncbi:hypothetical protein CDAR_480391 [Caerostris darwini]|uniref:Uncharacterized protein n=1 Tax=Caerostris darwini TaxID=1538125 RepID=A0AAV4V281_9ARAC|nr:hypothetical protein CDAR_480391 [Caerostris darwini]
MLMIRLLNLVPFYPYQFICLTYGPVYFPFLSSTPKTPRKGVGVVSEESFTAGQNDPLSLVTKVRSLAINNVRIRPNVSNLMFILHIHSQARSSNEMFIYDQPFLCRQPLFSQIVRPISHVDDPAPKSCPISPVPVHLLDIRFSIFSLSLFYPKHTKKGGCFTAGENDPLSLVTMVRSLAIKNVQIRPDVSNPMFLLHIHFQARSLNEMYIDDCHSFAENLYFPELSRRYHMSMIRLLNLVPFHPYLFICLTYGPVYFPFSVYPNHTKKGGGGVKKSFTAGQNDPLSLVTMVRSLAINNVPIRPDVSNLMLILHIRSQARKPKEMMVRYIDI